MYWKINPTSKIVIEKNGYVITSIGTVKPWFDLWILGAHLEGSLDLLELLGKI